MLVFGDLLPGGCAWQQGVRQDSQEGVQDQVGGPLRLPQPGRLPLVALQILAPSTPPPPPGGLTSLGTSTTAECEGSVSVCSSCFKETPWAGCKGQGGGQVFTAALGAVLWGWHFHGGYFGGGDAEYSHTPGLAPSQARQ